MTDRQERLLKLIIDEYISTAEPVSSKLLEESGFFGLSSATIRAEMNELEHGGYLEQPHTSAGRAPTDKAYRFYVDNLVRTGDIEPESRLKQKIKTTVAKMGNDPRSINKAVANLLSELSDSLVITNIIESDDFYKSGLSSLFNHPEFRELNRAFELAKFFDHFEAMFNEFATKFIAEIDSAYGINIFIGQENPMSDIHDESVITGRYKLPHNFTGSITLIGPTRMNYARNISLVKCTTGELDKLAQS